MAIVGRVPDIEIALAAPTSGGRTGLVSVTRIGGVFVARVIHGEMDRPESWLTVSAEGGPIGLAGGGGTSYDGETWTSSFRLGQHGQTLPDSPVGLSVAVDGVDVELHVTPLATRRSLVLREAAASRDLLSLGCRGCGRSGQDSYCDECGSAIDQAGRRGALTRWKPEAVIPLGVSLGQIDGAEVLLIDLEVYDRSSILRSWWGIEAEPDQELSELKSPLDRRLQLSTDTGDDLVVAPGSSWETDGHGVLTDHRIPAHLDTGARTLRIHTPGQSAMDLALELPGT